MIKVLTIVLVLLPVSLFGQFTYALEESIPVSDNDQNELPAPWAGGLNAAHYNTMDLDDDGKEDLVLFDRTADKVLTFLNKDDQYRYAPEYETFFPEEITNWLLLRDFNCDGKKDIFTGDILGIKVYMNETQAGGNISWKQFLFYSGPGGTKSPVLLTKGFSGKINLQLQFDDLPAIIDADGDGDLDIFNVRFVGNGTIEYHQNFAVERYGTCDSLDFERITQKWGDITECNCGNFAFHGEDCPPISGGRTQHAGGKSLLALDVDGDAVLDMLFSEASCSRLYLLKNEGTLADPLINAVSDFPSSAPVNFSIFPAAFYEDLNFDGKKDLVAIPNIFSRTTINTNLKQSNWLYTNSGTTSAPSFAFAKNNFLQDIMIDVGDNAVPAFADYDADGDYDLFVAQHTSANFASKITCFENIGTPTDPSFVLVDDDIWGFSEMPYYNLKIQFADIDSDSRIDLVFTATSFDSGKTSLYYLLNKGSTSLNFSGQNLQTTGFTVGFSENVTVTDINQDGLADVLVGKSDGSLAYWQNAGPRGTINLSLADDTYLGLSATVLRQNVACTISDLDADGKSDLVYGDQSGRLKIIPSFREAADDGGVFTQVIYNALSERYESKNLGGRTWPTVVNLFNNTQPAIVVGNVLGGISVLRHDEGEPLPESPTIDIYPNPVAREEALTIRIDRPALFQIYSVLGHELTEPAYLAAHEDVAHKLPNLSAGVYVLRFTISNKSFVRRIVVY